MELLGEGRGGEKKRTEARKTLLPRVHANDKLSLRQGDHY